METPNSNLSLDQVEKLMKAMQDHGMGYLNYQGVEIKESVHKSKPNERKLLIPIGTQIQEPEDGDEKPKPKKAKSPTDEEILLNPYVGIEQ